MKLTMYDFLRLGHVKRWHNVNTIREQTVAEHSYMVTLIALSLFNHVVGVKDDKDFALTVMMKAMFHDAPEVVMGDAPTPAKRYIREFTGDPEIFDKMDRDLMPEVPFIGGTHTTADDFIKMADAIEGAHWIQENGAGRHAEIVAAANWRRVEDTVEKLDKNDPESNWYEAVNEVLMALGMRYVHKQSRITPP